MYGMKQINISDGNINDFDDNKNDPALFHILTRTVIFKVQSQWSKLFYKVNFQTLMSLELLWMHAFPDDPVS